MTVQNSPQIETRIVEVLDAIREVLNRLATLEEKTMWHNNFMNQLSSGQKEISDRVMAHDQDRGRIALLERDFQYLVGDMSKISKQVEVLSDIASELQRNDTANSKTVSLIESFGAQLLVALISAGGGAIAMKILGT